MVLERSFSKEEALTYETSLHYANTNVNLIKTDLISLVFHEVIMHSLDLKKKYYKLETNFERNGFCVLYK